MALLEKTLVVKKSTIPGAGKGLFTRKPIAKGTRIVEYKGRISTWKEAGRRSSDSGYIYYITRNYVIDALTHPAALARYANDASGISRTKGVTNNSEYVEDEKKVYIVAKKDIPANAEILVGYGKEYWDVMKENRKNGH